MRRHLLVLVGLVAGLAVGAGGAVAASGGDGGHTKPAAESSGATEALGGGSASHARMAALINGSEYNVPGPPPNFGIVRSVAVRSVTNPADGTFCIRPDPVAIPTAQVSKLIPTVAATFSGSAEYQAFAQYVTPRPASCPVGSIGVFTFSANAAGNLDTADNDVAFTIVVD
jgi:hypothetical protein